VAGWWAYLPWLLAFSFVWRSPVPDTDNTQMVQEEGVKAEQDAARCCLRRAVKRIRALKRLQADGDTTTSLVTHDTRYGLQQTGFYCHYLHSASI